MHQGRGIQCLAGVLTGQPGSRQLPQLVIDQRQELLRSQRISASSRIKKLSGIVHENTGSNAPHGRPLPENQKPGKELP
jgi:hypothetical protein